MLRLSWLSLYAFAVATTVGVWYFVQKRKETRDLPQPPRSFIWGNLKAGGECMTLFPPGAHQHNWIAYLRKKYNLGDVIFLDLWPLGPRFCYLTDPEVISQYITTGQSLTKAALETDYVNLLLGRNNMVSLEGTHWKRQRAMFNPVFSATHLMTMVPYIVEASMVFYGVLHGKAEAGELFPLEEYATRLTIDIIGKVVLDADFDSQKGSHPIVETFRKRVALMPNASSIYPWDDFNPVRPYKLWANGKKLDGLIGEELDAKLKERALTRGSAIQAPKQWKKSVVDLALDGYEKEMALKGQPTTATIEAQIRSDIIDSMKTFIFAGHDTTASTISYIFYLLHFHSNVYSKLVEELDNVFGTADVHKVAEKIKVEPHIINRLEYGNAVIKETLRLFPPASTMRDVPKTSDPAKVLHIPDKKTGQRWPVSGCVVWPAVHAVSRNEDFFPKPAHFIPERFIPSQTPFPDSKLFTAAGKDAWRPFEKGPRNCIGQELAMVESRVFLALCVRDFDFVSEFEGVKYESWTPVEMVDEFRDGRSGSERLTIEGHRCYQVLKGAAKPCDGLPGRIRRRGDYNEDFRVLGKHKVI